MIFATKVDYAEGMLFRFVMISILIACVPPKPMAPPIGAADTGFAVLVDGGETMSGANPDRYRPLDVGQLPRPDVPDLPLARHDAGYELLALPGPVSSDPCGDICRGRPCASECRQNCRDELPRIAVHERELFIDCVAQNSCDLGACLPDEMPIDPACERLCDNEHLEACGIPELATAGPHCAQRCTGYLASMYPAARQGFLQCGIDHCIASGASCAGTGYCEVGEHCGQGRCIPEKQCPIIDFVGPEPSGECLDVARYRQRCHHPRKESLYQDAWECESWRPNRDNLEWAAGNLYVSCLANRQVCDGYNAYWDCLGEAMAAKGRRRLVDEVCTHIQACDSGKGWTCNYVMAGASRWVGEHVAWKLDRCSASAGLDCEALEACIDGLWAVEGPDDTCRRGCERCGQVNDRCINLCLYHRNSMTRLQARQYEHCLRLQPACGDNVAETCVREVLEGEMEVCDRLMESIGECAEWENYTENIPWPGWCAIGGIRTGLLTTDRLETCVEMTNCRIDPWRACAR
ncbi:MAG: hypothetical protein CMH58_09540 [Myxococcales bacterium]|nr:hypothetical protein [Myxococcales bacterium]